MNFKSLAATALLLLPAFASAQEEAPNAVRLTYADGEVTELLLESAPSCRFAEDDLVVTAGDDTFVFSLEGGSVTATFVKIDGSGAETFSDDARKAIISLTAYGIEISGLRPGSAVTAYDLTGRHTASVAADGNGNASLQLPAGVSIISTEEKSFKIIRK